MVADDNVIRDKLEIAVTNSEHDYKILAGKNIGDYTVDKVHKKLANEIAKDPQKQLSVFYVKDESLHPTLPTALQEKYLVRELEGL